MNFDIVIISFSKPATDARTINLVNTLLNNGKTICLIALKDDFNIDGLNFIPIEINPNQRMFKRWFEFYIKTKKLKNQIHSEFALAGDLYTLPIICNLFNKKETKLIYDSREIYSALGPLQNQPLKQRIITFIEKKFIYQVDEFIVTGMMDAEYLKQSYNLDSPFHLIMNLPPFKEIVKSTMIRDKYDISDDSTVLLYQGEILEGRGLRLTIDSIKLTDNCHFVIIGDGPYKNSIIAYIKEMGLLDRVHLKGKVAYEDLHEWTCSADIGLTLFEPISKSYELALPNKLFEYCMAGIPSLATDLAPIKEVIKQNEIAQLIPKNQITGKNIAESITYIMKNENYKKFTSECHNSARKYSYGSQENIILDIFK